MTAPIRIGGLGAVPWPPAYQDRLRALERQQDALRAILLPLRDAARAFHALGALGAPSPQGDLEAHARWPLPAGGAVLEVRAGFFLHADVGEIAAGVIPAPDPLVCLASALHTPELWTEAMAVFRKAGRWATKQAAEYGLEAETEDEADAAG